ncbi:MAG: DUF1648 domain-containing protein [Candidatus Kapabacteria bacterium]|nr:DUF1648 domain-containing protein [Candidatus Kapabacteria bacterium]
MRPKIKIKSTRTDKSIEAASIIALLYSLYAILNGLITLPATIPTHFDFYGNPDRYGSKMMILIPVVIMGHVKFLGIKSYFCKV